MGLLDDLSAGAGTAANNLATNLAGAAKTIAGVPRNVYSLMSDPEQYFTGLLQNANQHAAGLMANLHSMPIDPTQAWTPQQARNAAMGGMMALNFAPVGMTAYHGSPMQAPIHESTGLPMNPDGTVTLYHHTSAANAKAIKASGVLKSAAEPDVYLTTHATPDIGYGDTAVPVDVNPNQLMLDDEFPDGRQDFRIDVGKPGGTLRVKVK